MLTKLVIFARAPGRPEETGGAPNAGILTPTPPHSFAAPGAAGYFLTLGESYAAVYWTGANAPKFEHSLVLAKIWDL